MTHMFIFKGIVHSVPVCYINGPNFGLDIISKVVPKNLKLKMNHFIVFSVLAMFAATSWNVNGSSDFQSTGVSTTTVNGVTVQTTYNNGKAEYTIDGKPVTEQVAKDILAQGNGKINTSNGNINTPEEKQAFDKKMEESKKDMAKPMEDMKKQTA